MYIKGEIMDPESFNAYGYCCGNPVVWVDFDGKRKNRRHYHKSKHGDWLQKIGINRQISNGMNGWIVYLNVQMIYSMLQ